MGSSRSGRGPACAIAVGSVYWDWTVEAEGPRYRRYWKTWRCRCLCGATGIVIGSRLASGKSNACHGCMMARFRARRAAMRKDRTGAVSGRWTVTGPGSRPGRWAVVCDCGRVGEITSRTVRRGNSPGCRECTLADIAGRRPVPASPRRPGEDPDRYSRGSYLPTPEEIRAVCRQIRQDLGHPITPDLS